MPQSSAAWIVEKFRTWSDCDGDVERVYTKDELLTNIMLYWVTECISSSVRIYYERTQNPLTLEPGQRVEVPTAISIFPKDFAVPPRKLIERSYNVTHWTAMPKGGHFAAMEQPELLAADIRDAFRPLR